MSRGTWIFLFLGLALQLVTYVIMPTVPLSLISGILGVCSVVLGAQGNLLTFVFGFAQVGTYTYLCYEERFYAEIGLNIYYFLTMIYGVYVWMGRRKSNASLHINTRRMSGHHIPCLLLSTMVLAVLLGWGLQSYTDDPQPYLDAFTTVPALVAQLLMILAYREQWYLWILVDVLALIMWVRAGDYCMAAQYLFWCANCVYGYFLWTKSINKE